MDISILGCGWLGLPLAETLVEEGHVVRGSTTTRSKLELLDDRNIEPYLITLDPGLNCNDCDDFWNSELLIINIPPGRGKEGVISRHTSQISSIIDRLRKSTIKNVIFISSTSVYPKTGGVMSEEDAVPGSASRESGEALIKAEQQLVDEPSFNTIVLRFGGLYGYDRHPVTYLAGKKDLPGGCAPVNLIHRDDCIGIITELIKKDMERGIFNAVSDGHPPRKTYYAEAAKQLELDPPEFTEDDGSDYKVVSNRKLKETLGYRFKYPNPMDFRAP